MAKKASRDLNDGCNELASAFGGTPLHIHIPSLKATAVGAGGEPAQGLASLGIEDAEQLVALSNTDEKHKHLAASLGISHQALETHVKEARKVLRPPTLLEMETPLPPLYAMGAIAPDGDVSAAAEPFSMPPLGLPSTVNLIPSMSAIRNQGQRGTCVSFALTAINEYVRAVQGHPVDLSEQHLYHEIKLIDGSPASCGTWQKFGAQVLASRGQCREVIWPYNPNLPCNNNGVMPANARRDAAAYKVALSPLNPKDVLALKSALAARKPVGISIPVFNSWYTSPETKRSGRITMPLANDPQVGGHALTAVGYQDLPSSPGGGYFIIRNHWSTAWGYQNPYGHGYGVIPYQYITSYNWEAYTLSGGVGDADIAPSPHAEPAKTVTLSLRGNVNLIIE
ncbi:MAG TPA: C1 family peptidase [Phycisphaerae bacterium]|nr:C1 family peptidase [Phycisphaerae bacterium]